MDELDTHIKRFQQDLTNNSLDDECVVDTYISFGTPYIFKHEETLYYQIKKQIAKHYKVHHSEVIMIGSAKLGFSIAPLKLWKKFNDESDIDMVVISEDVFDLFWKSIYNFNIALSIRSEQEDKQFKQFLEYFFKGWLRPDLFPFKIDLKNKWFDFFTEISYKQYGSRKITGAVFKNYYFFNQYHINRIKELRTGGVK